jgi:predicted esterase
MTAREHHLEVARTARYWTLGDATAPREVWYVLHGYKQLARRFLRRFDPVMDASRLIVAPEALSRFYVSSESGRHGASSIVGATWMTREDRGHEIRDYVRYLDTLSEAVAPSAPVGPGSPEKGRQGAPSIVVLGFSQGVATAVRWVVRGSVRPKRLILWGDYSPPDLDLERARAAFAGIDLVAVRGNQDPALSSRLAEEEAVRLHAAGIDLRTVRYDGGHEIDADTLVALAGGDGPS